MSAKGCTCSGPSWQEPYGHKCDVCEDADLECPDCVGEGCQTCLPADDAPSADDVLRELSRVKVLFQARTIALIMGFPHAAD